MSDRINIALFIANVEDQFSNDIMKGLNKGPGSYLKDIYSSIEREVLYRRVKNEKDAIMTYIMNNYKVEN